MLRQLLFALLTVLLVVSSVVAAEVIMVEKRQATGNGYPVESTQKITLADGQDVKLVTCCGLNQDDSALYTVRDRDGYTLVDRKFTSGRYFLSPNGRLVSVQKKGLAFTVTFSDHLLNAIKEINLVAVQNLTVGDQGSVAALVQRGDKRLLRLYDNEGNQRWELKDAPAGSLYFLPGEKYLALTAGEVLFLHSADGENVRNLKTDGPVRFIGADAAIKTLFVVVDGSAGPAIEAYDLGDFTRRWQHAIPSTPAGHCRDMEVELARFVSGPQVIAVLLRCPGERRVFYVARFLGMDGNVLGQKRLGRRIDASFYEVGSTFAIVSEGFVYSFAKRD
jgi:hypothetical protein